MDDLVMTGATADECWPLVRDYHYSKRMPSAIQHCFAWRRPGGLFGDAGDIVAAIIYGIGINNNWPNDALELQRLVRIPEANVNLTELIAFSIKWLKKNKSWDFVYSYADSTQGHHGGVYQAANFYFIYESLAKTDGYINVETGETIHGRSLRHNNPFTRKLLKYLKESPQWMPRRLEKKYCYVYPLRRRFKQISKERGWQQLPFPKPDNASRLLDEPLPEGVSQEHTLGDAPRPAVGKIAT